MDGVNSRDFTINKIIEKDYAFNIPIYQRLYVWTNEQVKTLFEDLFLAFKNNKGIYYIGGVIIVKNNKDKKLFDLVDGQQRFTTLWLLANELQFRLKDFIYRNENLRLQFSIRTNVEKYLKNLESKESNFNNEYGDYQDLIRIDNARMTIRSLITEYLKNENDKKMFSRFVLRNLKVVVTEVPEKTDLNKLFETLNNRGLQLKQHEILKSKLLKHIPSREKRNKYGGIWDICSKMNNYLERIIAKEVGSSKKVGATYNNGFLFQDILNLIEKQKKDIERNLNLSSIIKEPEKYSEYFEDKGSVEFHPKTQDDELNPVRSILTFPQLLLHTLRIFLHKKGRNDIKRINEKELLWTFENSLLSEEISKKEVLEFIELLFKVRFSFDKYVIKWVEINEDEEIHQLKKIYKQNQKKGGWSYYLRRMQEKRLNGIALLQSVLYHSQQNTTQYWLTPFLNWMVEYNPDFKESYHWLRVLDNTLLSSDTDESLTNRTWNSMGDYLEKSPSISVFETENEIKKAGTQFPHYWFYKIEFVLWYYRKDEDLKEAADKWENYKITARNSLEHIGPQNPRDDRDRFCNEMLDAMGNLVLVTRSINSEYSDMPYKVKRSKFTDKKEKGFIDSLKSDLIYSRNSCWNKDTALEHQNFVIKKLKKYFNENEAH